jgi:hypothetical protein
MIRSQQVAAAPQLVDAVANAVTLGIAAALQRRALTEAEAERREQLEDMRLPEPLLALLDREMRTAVGGTVEHDSFQSEIGTTLQIQYTVARTPAMDVVLIDIPASILSNGKSVRRLQVLFHALRGKTVRVFSRDLTREPSSALNGLKTLWATEERQADKIDLDYVPLAHVEELERKEADLGNVLKLNLKALAKPAKPPVPESPAGEQRGTAIRKLKIFLASSEELREDRDGFDHYFRQRNDEFTQRGIYLEVVRWENFLDAMSETRLQDEYNRAVRDCDIFVCLLFTKTGTFTEEEFDTAYDQFKKTGKPRIFTFFKNGAFMTGDLESLDDLNSLLKFKEKLRKLEHFYTEYTSIDNLRLQFERQLDKLGLR